MTSSTTGVGVSFGTRAEPNVTLSAARREVNAARTESGTATESGATGASTSSAVTTYSRNGSPLSDVVRCRGCHTPFDSSAHADQIVTNWRSPHIAQKTFVG